MSSHTLLDIIEQPLSSAHGCARGEPNAPGALRPPGGGFTDADGRAFDFQLLTFDCYPPALCAPPGGGFTDADGHSFQLSTFDF